MESWHFVWLVIGPVILAFIAAVLLETGIDIVKLTFKQGE